MALSFQLVSKLGTFGSGENNASDKMDCGLCVGGVFAHQQFRTRPRATATGTERATVNTETMTTRVVTIRIGTVKLFVDGMTDTGATFLQGLRRKTSCLLD